MYSYTHSLTVVALSHTRTPLQLTAGSQRKEERDILLVFVREVKDGIDDIAQDQYCQEWQCQDYAGLSHTSSLSTVRICIV